MQLFQVSPGPFVHDNQVHFQTFETPEGVSHEELADEPRYRLALR